MFTEEAEEPEAELDFHEISAPPSDLGLSLEPRPVLNQTNIYDPATLVPAGFVLPAIITFIIQHNPIRSCFPANFHSGGGGEKQHSPTPGLGSASGAPLPPHSHADGEWEASARFPHGWETYGPTWCYVTPQPPPSARRPRCAQPASLSPSPTPLERRQFTAF